jgi:hypothetical protein
MPTGVGTAMIEPFKQVLDELEGAFRRLEDQVPPPKEVPHGEGYVFRYEEKTPQQAVLQKFARLISGLHAINLLSKNGFCQEQGVIQRTLDDIDEDILFITLGLSTGEWTVHHEKYLEHFWAEEPGPAMVRRDKIRAYVHRICGPDDTAQYKEAGRTIFRTYSGYVHAASINIVDMCAGNPPRYHLAGMLESPLYGDHEEDAWSYFYRGLCTGLVMAKAFEDEELWHERYRSQKAFEAAFGDKLFPQR